jgi:hypothetical protein
LIWDDRAQKKCPTLWSCDTRELFEKDAQCRNATIGEDALSRAMDMTHDATRQLSEGLVPIAAIPRGQNRLNPHKKWGRLAVGFKN